MGAWLGTPQPAFKQPTYTQADRDRNLFGSRLWDGVSELGPNMAVRVIAGIAGDEARLAVTNVATGYLHPVYKVPTWNVDVLPKLDTHNFGQQITVVPINKITPLTVLPTTSALVDLDFARRVGFDSVEAADHYLAAMLDFQL